MVIPTETLKKAFVFLIILSLKCTCSRYDKATCEKWSLQKFLKSHSDAEKIHKNIPTLFGFIFGICKNPCLSHSVMAKCNILFLVTLKQNVLISCIDSNIGFICAVHMLYLLLFIDTTYLKIL